VAQGVPTLGLVDFGFLGDNEEVSTSTMRAPAKPPASTAPRRRSGWMLLIVWSFVLAMAVAVIAPVAAAVDVVASARSYDTTQTDAIAVLGASQYWGEPSPIFENRLDHAADLWRDGVAPFIITVGGKQPGDNTTEAEAGKAYLVASGVPADRVVALPDGTNTLESVEDVAATAKARDWTSITLVSDRAHLARSKAIAMALGLDAHVSGRAFEDGSGLGAEKVGREVAGLLRFHFFDRWFLER